MIVLDATELVNNPVRTGIQRVVLELIRRWPADIPMQVAYFNPARGLVPMPDWIVKLVTDHDPAMSALGVDEIRVQVSRAQTLNGIRGLVERALGRRASTFPSGQPCARCLRRSLIAVAARIPSPPWETIHLPSAS